MTLAQISLSHLCLAAAIGLLTSSMPAFAGNPQALNSVNPKDGAEMVFIPAGEFLMGSTPDQVKALQPGHPTEFKAGYFDPEQPQRTVKLSGYWMYRTEVTVAQYRKFCQETGRMMPDMPQGGWKDAAAMTSVSWFDASAYAKWAVVRLPTEAEWEKAARGTDGRTYPWGDTWDEKKCADPHSTGYAVMPVGSFPDGASPYGVLDMAGNVWEWCQDWFSADYYVTAPNLNPPGPPTGTHKVMRGGSYGTWAGGVYFRCAYRDTVAIPGYARFDFGFRCAVDDSTEARVEK